jgi:TonB family protein
MEKHERVLAAARNERTLESGKSSNPATAGSKYGSLSDGDISGQEIRPALWTSGPNPALAADDFAQGLQGSVIVEITIDEQGNVVATSLLQGLSPAVDARVIEALQMAHFVPAKRNGVSIPSKQDVYYHFPR